ncbi:MAG: TIGR04255 family protein [Pirellulaceae bacterium]|nr:TIGR04255 family protein [Pirellulaceae bacterium]MDP6717488.1 TIGR04255 family protein [Pirellulaceae bacterium]
MTQPLPEFENPPVVEVALSVQFDRLDVTTVQLGTVWQRFRDRFARVEEKLELDAAFERFGPPEKKVPGVRFEVGGLPTPRLWFIDESGSELVQVQRDRFIRNWRKIDGQPNYPRYDTLRAAFVNDWEIFSGFVAEELKASLVPNQCEVTYVNIIEAIDSSRLDQILACISGSNSDEYLGKPEGAEVQFRYVLKDETEKPWGRLHVAAGSAMRATDNQPVVRLSLTARGATASKDTAGAMNTLDAGHEAVVRGFTSMTSPEMHTAWGRKS